MADRVQGAHRLVHLDLKGAPPRVEYYKKIFPLLRAWGANGLLVEYEDTFPYEGELKVLQAQHAYTEENIKTLQTLAAQHGLEIIPLVQTFGHFEFVLKHDKFRHLRELAPFPMALCPSNPESLILVKEMIAQLLRAHPDTRFLHIGADEVPHIGFCEACEKLMREKSLTRDAMFFMHVRRVLEHVRTSYPHVTCIMWDDMFRHLSSDVIKDSGIGELVEPMVWYYQHSFNNLPADIWTRYSAVFNQIWVASAFKGATGASVFLTDIGYHIENHKGWLEIEAAQIRPKFSLFRGFCLTGWQRYDHYATLCELLPVGLPSLAMCLLILKHGAFTLQSHEEASKELGFKELIPLNPYNSPGVIPECEFPGSDVFKGALRTAQLVAEQESLMRDDRFRAWMTPYHIRYNFTNPGHLHHFLPPARVMMEALTSQRDEMTRCMDEIFYPDVSEEFVCVVIEPRLEEVTKLVNNAEKQLTLMGGVKRTNMQT